MELDKHIPLRFCYEKTNSHEIEGQTKGGGGFLRQFSGCNYLATAARGRNSYNRFYFNFLTAEVQCGRQAYNSASKIDLAAQI